MRFNDLAKGWMNIVIKSRVCSIGAHFHVFTRFAIPTITLASELVFTAKCACESSFTLCVYCLESCPSLQKLLGFCMCGALNTSLQLVSGDFYLCCFMEDVNCIILYVKLVCD